MRKGSEPIKKWPACFCAVIYISVVYQYIMLTVFILITYTYEIIIQLEYKTAGFSPGLKAKPYES